MRDSSYIFIPCGNENYGVAAVETGGKQQSTGLLQLDGFESRPASDDKKENHTVWRGFLFGRG